jgi:hypothetical protein
MVLSASVKRLDSASLSGAAFVTHDMATTAPTIAFVVFLFI